MFSFAILVNLAIRATYLISGDVIQARMRTCIDSIGLMHPVTICNVSFSIPSSL